MQLEAAIQQKKFKSEYEKVVINLLYTSGWLQVHQQRFFKQFDISPQQYNVLRILRGQYPNAATVSLVQERMLDKMSNASRLIEKLKQKGFVDRNECPNDRRQVDVKITERGLDLLKAIDNHREDVEQIMASISKTEATQLNNLLDKLRTYNN